MNNRRTSDPGFTKFLLPSGRGSTDFEPERNVGDCDPRPGPISNPNFPRISTPAPDFLGGKEAPPGLSVRPTSLSHAGLDHAGRPSWHLRCGSKTAIITRNPDAALVGARDVDASRERRSQTTPDVRDISIVVDWHKLHITLVKSWITLSCVSLEIRGLRATKTLARQSAAVVHLYWLSFSPFFATPTRRATMSITALKVLAIGLQLHGPGAT